MAFPMSIYGDGPVAPRLPRDCLSPKKAPRILGTAAPPMAFGGYYAIPAGHRTLPTDQAHPAAHVVWIGGLALGHKSSGHSRGSDRQHSAAPGPQLHFPRVAQPCSTRSLDRLSDTGAHLCGGWSPKA